MSAKTSANFTISRNKEKEGVCPKLIISPTVPNEGYEPFELSISNEQWDKLRYHFVSMANDRSGDVFLAYVY